MYIFSYVCIYHKAIYMFLKGIMNLFSDQVRASDANVDNVSDSRSRVACRGRQPRPVRGWVVGGERGGAYLSTLHCGHSAGNTNQEINHTHKWALVYLSELPHLSQHFVHLRHHLCITNNYRV